MIKRKFEETFGREKVFLRKNEKNVVSPNETHSRESVSFFDSFETLWAKSVSLSATRKFSRLICVF